MGAFFIALNQFLYQEIGQYGKILNVFHNAVKVWNLASVKGKNQFH